MCKWKILFRRQGEGYRGDLNGRSKGKTWHVEYVEALNAFNALDKFIANHIGENVFVDELVMI